MRKHGLTPVLRVGLVCALFAPWLLAPLGCPPETPGPEPVCTETNPLGVVTTRTPGAGRYTAGATIDFTLEITVTCPEQLGDLSAFGLLETIPEGWTFDSLVAVSAGDEPSLTPAPAETGQLGFLWIFPPEFPVTLTYRVFVPQGEAGARTTTGQALYRLLGPEHQSAVTATLLEGAAP